MKKLYFLILTVLILCNSIQTFSQIKELSLSEKVGNSNLIVEGKVIERKSLYDEKTKHIYTQFKIEVYKVLKGNYNTEITLVEIGGSTNEDFEFYDYTNKYSNGDYGLFFCNQSNTFESMYETFGGIQGFIRINTEKNFQTAVTSFVTYQDIQKTLFLPIKEIASTEAIRVKPNPKEQSIIDYINKKGIAGNYFTSNAIEYNYDNINAVLGANNYIEFDIFAKVNANTFQFSDAEIKLIYDVFSFGNNIDANNHITITPGTILLSPDYNINISDINSSEVAISISSNSTPNNLFNLSITPELLCHIKVDIQNFSSNAFVNFDDASMQNLSKYLNANNVKVPFSQVIANDSIYSPQQTASILSFFPTSVPAGTGQKITILGSGFGSTQGNGKVEFSKCIVDPISWIEPIPIEYLSWSDNQIEVIVPSNHNGTANASIGYTAATGPIRVWANGASSSATSNSALFIPYSVQNVYVSGAGGDNYNLIHRDINSFGGVVLNYDPNMSNTAGAISAFERALVKWRCATGINFVVDNTLTNSTMVCPIEFTTLPANQAGQGGFIGSHTACLDPNTSSIEAYNVKGVTMRYDDATTTWYTGTSNTLPPNEYDLETVTLHEMGHMHLLRHTNNIDDLMYPTYTTTSPLPRIITQYSLEGGNYIMTYSSFVGSTQTNCFDPMVPFVQTGCENIIWNSTNDINFNANNYTCYPNPTNNSIAVKFDLATEQENISIIITNQFGQKISNPIKLQNCKAGLNYYSIDVANLSKGLYFINLTNNTSSKTIKFIKQ